MTLHWPQFRGPNGLGVAPDGKKLPVHFGPSKNVVWKTALPFGHSSPCIWGDRIFLTGFDKPAKKLETFCLDRQTGKVLWRQPVPAEKVEKTHPVNSPASSTPATDGERVYVQFGSFGLLCYDFAGHLQWKRPLPPATMQSGPSNFQHGSGASPVVAGDFLLAYGSPQGRIALLALNPRTGETVWQSPLPSQFGVWSTPLHHRYDGSDEVITAGGGQLAAYALTDGTKRWQVVGLPPTTYSTPAIADGLAFVTLSDQWGDPLNIVQITAFDEFAKEYDKNKDRKIGFDEIPTDFALVSRGRSDKIGDFMMLRQMSGFYDKNKDKSLDEKEWAALIADQNKRTSRVQIAAVAVRLGGQGDVTKTHVAWKETKGVPEVPSPLCYQGRLYLVKERSIISCLDPKTGKLLYRERLPVVGQCYASPVAGDGKVYAASDGGQLVVLKAGDQFEVLAKNDLGEPIMATPAMVEGKLYVRTAGHLYAFGE